MGDQVYRLGALRKKVVDALRAKGAPMGMGALCDTLALPLWAVEAGLDAATLAGMVGQGPEVCTWVLSVTPAPGEEVGT